MNAYGVTTAFFCIDPKVADMDKFREISVDCALFCQHFSKISQLLYIASRLAVINAEPGVYTKEALINQSLEYCNLQEMELLATLPIQGRMR